MPTLTRARASALNGIPVEGGVVKANRRVRCSFRGETAESGRRGPFAYGSSPAPSVFSVVL